MNSSNGWINLWQSLVHKKTWCGDVSKKCNAILKIILRFQPCGNSRKAPFCLTICTEPAHPDVDYRKWTDRRRALTSIPLNKDELTMMCNCQHQCTAWLMLLTARRQNLQSDTQYSQRFVNKNSNPCERSWFWNVTFERVVLNSSRDSSH